MASSSRKGKQKMSQAQQNVGDSPRNYDRALWDYDTTGIFLELVHHEKEIGNFGGQRTLTPTGYKNMVQNLLARTGIVYEKKQIKNKFEHLRNDFKVWLELTKHETSIGWNNYAGTIDADNAWWTQKIVENRDVRKFWTNGLPHLELMFAVFSSGLATGKYQYTPSANNFAKNVENWGTPQSPQRMQTSQDQEVTSPMRGHMRDTRSQSQKSAGSKRKSSDYEDWSRGLENLRKSYMDAQSIERRHHHFINGNSTFEHQQQCVAVLNAIDGLHKRDPLYQVGIEAFESENKRNMFILLDNDDTRMDWLQRQKRLQNR